VRLATRTHGDVLVIAPGSGDDGPTVDLTGKSLESLRNHVSAAIGEGSSRVVLDLGCVRFVDSEGIGALVMYKKLTTDGGGDLKLIRPRGRIRELLHAVRLDQVFDVYEDENDAVQAFEASSGHE